MRDWSWQDFAQYLVVTVCANLVFLAYIFIPEIHKQNLKKWLFLGGLRAFSFYVLWLPSMFYLSAASFWEQRENGVTTQSQVGSAVCCALFALYCQNERLHGQKEPAA